MRHRPPICRRLGTALSLAALGVLLSTGCVIRPDGRPYGSGAVGAFGSVLGIGSHAGHHGHYAAGPDEYWADEGNVDSEMPAEMAPPVGVESFSDSYDEFSPVSQCAGGQCGCDQCENGQCSDCDHGHCPLRGRCRACEGGFCSRHYNVPPGPPDLPPPSRFFPVPTRPVFSPVDRQEPFLPYGPLAPQASPPCAM
jgi:hypothetical protein